VNPLRKYFKGDPIIWGIVMVLSVFGILAVYSSTGTLAYSKMQGNTEYYLFKHTGLLLVGLAVMWIAHRVDFRYYSRVAQILIFIAIPLLAYTLFFGTSVNEARRWITLPIIGFTFQTSDLAKLALIMYVARFLSKRQSTIEDARKAFYPILGYIVLVCVLIAPSDFSTAAVLFMTCLVLLFIGRIPIKQLAMVSGIGIVTVVLLFVYIYNFNPNIGRLMTYKARIEAYVDGDVKEGGNYQVEQAKIAIAKGGFTGKGPGKSTQRNFLPSPYADFIYAIIIEEYGMVFGGVLLLFLYLFLLYRSLRIVLRSPKAFGALLAVGLSFSLAVQALMNMGVAVNLLPVTGLPLPLVSMGGTSLFFTSFAFGIILSVSRSASTEEDD
jgi:cell division protein FtsW